ncbi:N-utilization substance protein B [Candidatus Kinetoplastibacterium desouzaii TCC079E]|uniref:Transcription antitermination protein NusB n=1 Tax=Candidatus Kinetoplastidibacterium desouzai TCC079E TaxID=1208919 RepID=M1M3K9_9PROT|nr:transcription antitermination factor NusB [Candidatus Kinetoplastibacterium desouzaii]AGF46830.1 N-utilization substance protein B [Candidatus Kinetoplastibacterium desouzaii TCC079E]
MCKLQRKMTSRRRSREFALQGIYSWLLTGYDISHIFSDMVSHLREMEDFKEADIEWFNVLIYGVLQNHDNLIKKILPYLDRPLKSISPIEHAILLIGSFELIEHLEIPYKVSINESVELAKSFGGTDGFKFINGVLDKLANSVRNTEIK